MTHVYGLTEVYGPATVCAWQEEWDELPPASAPGMLARQGVPYPALEGAGRRGPRRQWRRAGDGETIGELMLRGTRHEGLSEESESDRRGLCRRLVPYRRPRGNAPRRLCRDQGPLEGHHHLRRREYQLDRGRGGAVPSSASDRSRGRGPARRQMGRDALRLRHAEAEAATPPRRKSSRGVATSSPTTRRRRHVIFGPLPKTSTGKIQKYPLREQAKAATAS